MDIQSRKIKFVEEFLKLQSEEILSHLEKILRKETNASKDEEFEQMTIQGFKSAPYIVYGATE